MKIIWKYPIPIQTNIKIDMPVGAEVLHFALKEGQPYIWVLVATSMELETHHFHLYMMGHYMDHTIEEDYVGTVILPEDSSVYHLFQSI